jgi:predicted 3-demethylubiquinone-9 3-methyltransferase (glyoxalase superfamily)
MAAAIKLYTGLIPGSRLNGIGPMPTDTPSGPAGAVRMASFTLGDQNYMAIEAGPLDPFNRSFSIMVECDTQAEIDRLWDTLGEGGRYSQCGWLTDRWGLTWQITAARLGQLMTDPSTAKPVMQAMLKMSKIDLAALEAAAA